MDALLSCRLREVVVPHGTKSTATPGRERRGRRPEI
jgi:hypothetical protein